MQHCKILCVVCGCEFMCVLVKASGWQWVFPRSLFTFLFWNRVFHWTWNPSTWLVWLTFGDLSVPPHPLPRPIRKGLMNCRARLLARILEPQTQVLGLVKQMLQWLRHLLSSPSRFTLKFYIHGWCADITGRYTQTCCYNTSHTVRNLPAYLYQLWVLAGVSTCTDYEMLRRFLAFLVIFYMDWRRFKSRNEPESWTPWHPPTPLAHRLSHFGSYLHRVHGWPFGSRLHHHLQVVLGELSVQAKRHTCLWIKSTHWSVTSSFLKSHVLKVKLWHKNKKAREKRFVFN